MNESQIYLVVIECIRTYTKMTEAKMATIFMVIKNMQITVNSN